MKTKTYIYITFLILNFLALGLGSMFTADAVKAEWYTGLNKAPWTPPGWFFGFAWTTIMILFSFFMMEWYHKTKDKSHVIKLYALQWVLNVIWNPIFFYYELPIPAVMVIISLLSLVGWLLFKYGKGIGTWKWSILPYFVWLVVATSLNLYVIVFN